MSVCVCLSYYSIVQNIINLRVTQRSLKFIEGICLGRKVGVTWQWGFDLNLDNI